MKKLLCFVFGHKPAPILNPVEVRACIKFYFQTGKMVMVKCDRCKQPLTMDKGGITNA